jgi:DNA-binding beta-propeller fold protein YncE
MSSLLAPEENKKYVCFSSFTLTRMKKNLLPGIAVLTAIILYTAACSKEQKAVNNPASAVPVITSVFPASARAGDTITARGTNLPVDISTINVTINNKKAAIISLTPDSLKAVVPAQAGSGRVVMDINGKSYEGPEFIYTPKVIVSTIAGTGSMGTTNGAGLFASFYCPWGIAADKNGDLFIADCYNRLIRKISAGDSTVSSYSIPVQPGGANFYSPYNIAIDIATHNVYVTDFNQHLMRMDASGNMSVIYIDSMPLAGIAVSPDGKNLYISNNTLGTITKTTIDGKDPNIFTTGLITPRNIIFDNKGNMFVAAYPASVYGISTLDGKATAVATDPAFQGWEIAADTSGNFYLADHFANCIRKIDKSGVSSIIAGSGIAADIDGIGLDAAFNGPQGLAIDGQGNLYVTTFNYTTNGGNKVRKVVFQ